MPVSAVTALCTTQPSPALRAKHFYFAQRRCGGLWRSCQGVLTSFRKLRLVASTHTARPITRLSTGRAVEACHAFAGAGNGGGAGGLKKGTGRFNEDDSNNNSSWRISIAVLVCCSATAAAEHMCTVASCQVS